MLREASKNAIGEPRGNMLIPEYISRVDGVEELNSRAKFVRIKCCSYVE